ncbi:hypothetical protein FIBSPDRAFT_266222 [Athelia psychrophila]|uniref:Uncharacterized protein n=1 Tax=Athelia psychrophila TaxID=1759441 RepID=A0A165X735_9AGAM|nr:hypothetical protein FIBSPDRAFT_266222 [Fibularhizoctonia sp. CBS 109695]
MKITDGSGLSASMCCKSIGWQRLDHQYASMLMTHMLLSLLWRLSCSARYGGSIMICRILTLSR